MTMRPFTTLTGIAAPLPWSNVNTDDIWPGPGASPVLKAGRMPLQAPPDQHGPNAFAAVRWNDDLTPKPEFVLNRAPYDRAEILIARDNFGCGSSREMAVWALAAIGFRCVIAPSFGDIFHNNCFPNGVLPVRLPELVVEDLLRQAEDPDARFTVDLVNLQVTAPDGSVHAFAVGDYQRTMLLEGLDEITATLSRVPEINRAEAAYFARRPWLAPEALPAAE
jgi:3-isopropylmalate/(R)-2-methylmalate dehydratase small subunit